MRVRVRFRYRADTGEVETFIVEDLGGDQRATDHDARHDRATADVARVIEHNALIEEVLPGSAPEPQPQETSTDPDTDVARRRHLHE